MFSINIKNSKLDRASFDLYKKILLVFDELPLVGVPILAWGANRQEKIQKLLGPVTFKEEGNKRIFEFGGENDCMKIQLISEDDFIVINRETIFSNKKIQKKLVEKEIARLSRINKKESMCLN